jgi:hypothetical protein
MRDTSVQVGAVAGPQRRTTARVSTLSDSSTLNVKPLSSTTNHLHGHRNKDTLVAL